MFLAMQFPAANKMSKLNNNHLSGDFDASAIALSQFSHRINTHAKNRKTLGSLSKKVWILAAVGTDSPSNPLTVLHPSPFTVGRKPGQLLQINSRTVSNEHATLCVQDDGLLLTDNISTNGTFINGKRLNGSVLLAGGEYIQFADVAFRLRCDEQATATHTECHDVCDQALALVQFDRLMENRSVTPHFQPIVLSKTSKIVGYEVLARSRLLGLENATVMFSAATRLNMEVDLSAMLRWEAINQNVDLPEEYELYLNTHPRELEQDGLIESMDKLRRLAPTRKLVLEIHESAITSPAQMREFRSKLQEFDIRLAYDDFGAGQNRLVELSQAPPDILKFDMTMIRDLDNSSPERIRLVTSLVSMVHDLGVTSLAEGVETQGEAEICKEIGFELIQGYYYGRPAPPPRHNR